MLPMVGYGYFLESPNGLEQESSNNMKWQARHL